VARKKRETSRIGKKGQDRGTARTGVTLSGGDSITYARSEKEGSRGIHSQKVRVKVRVTKVLGFKTRSYPCYALVHSQPKNSFFTQLKRELAYID